MGDWNVFFATSAGSAATLVGLLFVATQLHLGVFSDPKNRWAALAQSTLTILSVNFALSLFFLMPILGSQIRGEVVVLADSRYRLQAESECPDARIENVLSLIHI